MLLIGRNKFPSRQDQSELGSDASTVWNFRARFSDVFGGETSGDVARILSRFLDDMFRRSGSLCPVAWLAQLSFNHEVDFSCV